MPPLPFVPGVLKVVLHHNNDGYGALNVFHIAYTGGPPDAAACDDVAGNVQLAWVGHVGPQSPVTLHLVAVEVTDLSSATGASGNIVGDWPGSINSSPMPSQVAVVNTFTTSLRYRGGHPKAFWPIGYTAAQADQSNWTAAHAATWQGELDNFRAAAGSGVHGSITLQGFVAVSYRSGHALRPVPVVLTLGLISKVDKKFGTMRRRINQPVTF